MKRRAFIPLGISGLVAALLVQGCDLLDSVLVYPVIEQRIEDFEDELNSGRRDTIYLHFHPESTESYAQIRDENWWKTTPLATANATFHITATGSPRAQVDGTYVVEAELEHLNTGSVPLATTFRMAQYASEWRILTLRIVVPGQQSAFEIKILPG